MPLKQLWKRLKAKLALTPIEIAMNEFLDFMVHGPLRRSTRDELLWWVDEVNAKLAVLRAVIIDSWDAEIVWQMKHVLKNIVVKRKLLNRMVTLPLLFDLTEDLSAWNLMPTSRIPSERFRARWRAAVNRDTSICHGIECFQGTRIIVGVVLDLIYGGNSDAEILQQFPSLAPKHLALANKAVRFFDSRGVGKRCKICGKHTRYGTYKMGIKAGRGFGYFICEECEEAGKDAGGVSHE